MRAAILRSGLDYLLKSDCTSNGSHRLECECSDKAKNGVLGKGGNDSCSAFGRPSRVYSRATAFLGPMSRFAPLASSYSFRFNETL